MKNKNLLFFIFLIFFWWVNEIDAINRTPLIVITDLYHPYQDPGDNFELINAYAIPSIDLKAVRIDC